MIEQLRLLLATDAVGGVWTYSLELAQALQHVGIRTSLAVMGPSPTANQREAAGSFDLIDTRLPLDWLATSPSELRHAGEALARIAREQRFDLVQTNSAALFADCEFDQPVIAVQHSCVASWWAAVKGTPLPHSFEWRRELVQRGLSQASAVVAPSGTFAEKTARIYGLGGPVLTVHNGRRPRLGVVQPQADFVFTASRLWDEGKNITTLDAAAARLKVPMEAAGPLRGPNGAAVQLQHIRALGEIVPEHVASLLAGRPIFTSAALYEPFGLSVLEAAQAGCALVLSDIPTHRELWGGAAIFVRARDDAAFALAIQDLLDDPDERQRLGQLALARARLYTPERMARGMADIYARVAEPRVPASAMAGAA